jgi:dipeptidyl aminopeptidase/acylaminoacyl peptidase
MQPLFGANRFLLVPALLAAQPLWHNDEPRRITDTDLYGFHWVADPQLSPDGTRVAYVQVTVGPKRDSYETSLWIASLKGPEPPRRLTSGPQDVSPAWSPDGETLAFLRSLKDTGEIQGPQVYLLRMDGGEAQRLTSLKKGAGSPAWSPDGKAIAFSSSSPSSTGNAQPKRDEPDRVRPDSEVSTPPGSQRRDSAKGKEEESDVRVITQAFFRLNGAGYFDSTSRDHIWTVSVPPSGTNPVVRQLTSGEFDENRPLWSPDGSRIYFISNRVREPYYSRPDADLFAIPAGGGEMKRVASIDGMIENYALSHDGKRIAFTGALTGPPVRSYDQPDLFVQDADAGAAPRNLTAGYDFDIDEGIASDQHAPRGRLSTAPVWTNGDSAIVVRAAERGRSNLKRVSLSGRVTPLMEGDHEVVAYSADRMGGRLAMVLSTPTEVGDIFVTSQGSSAAQLNQVTHTNIELFRGLKISPPEELWYKSFDGTRIQGWIQKPPDFSPGKRYPMILEIHGGPHSAYGYTFVHEFQWLAAQGYVVLYTNPRGSTSYGQKFGNIIQYHYPGDDYRDLMVGVDTLIRRGYIDPKRLGVTGGSGGGLLTNWVITQTDRFGAAVSQRSIADWASFWYTADFTQFTPFWFRKTPWQDPGEFRERSPITYVDRIKTPLMLVEGESDLRTPPEAGGEVMFRALKYLKKPVVMVRFPEETHELSRSGKPRHRVERLRHILNWFEKYLMDKNVPGYAVRGE